MHEMRKTFIFIFECEYGYMLKIPLATLLTLPVIIDQIANRNAGISHGIMHPCVCVFLALFVLFPMTVQCAVIPCKPVLLL